MDAALYIHLATTIMAQQTTAPFAARASVEDVFQEFCSFGSSKGTTPLMDNAKFAKLCRDLKLLDKKLTATDVDIIFSKCKSKTERKITFAQFKECLKLLAEKKYPGDELGLKRLEDELLTCGEKAKTNNVTKTTSSSFVARMTDTSKYTGTHKLRFDEDGKGRGLEGRDSVAKGSGMAAGSASALPSYVQGYDNADTYDGKRSESPKQSGSSKAKASPVVARLTDASKYTGAHKHRFDETGRGRGLEGRDLVYKGAGMSEGNVGDLPGYVQGYKHEGSYGKKK